MSAGKPTGRQLQDLKADADLVAGCSYRNREAFQRQRHWDLRTDWTQ